VLNWVSPGSASTCKYKYIHTFHITEDAWDQDGDIDIAKVPKVG
jgi:hypothetical protein